MTFRGFHPGAFSAMNLGDMRVGKYSSAFMHDGTGQCHEILQWMKLPLPGKKKCPTGIERYQRSAFYNFNIAQASASRGCEFAIEQVCRLAGRIEEISVDPFEVAFDLFAPDDLLDPINRGSMTFGGKFCALFSMETFQFEITI